MTSAESSASPLEAFRISRDSAYQRDMAVLETLISSENTDRAARQSAAEELQAYVALHQAQLALEGALLTSELAPCCAVVTDGSVTIVTEKQEITEQDTALVLTLVQVHTGVPASGGAHHDGAMNFVKSLFHFAKSGVYCLCQESAD